MKRTMKSVRISDKSCNSSPLTHIKGLKYYVNGDPAEVFDSDTADMLRNCDPDLHNRLCIADGCDVCEDINMSKYCPWW